MITILFKRWKADKNSVACHKNKTTITKDDLMEFFSCLEQGSELTN
ncbi:hypothetical protein [Flavobacterium cerinum]|uniref:Uncharacterized protein n=1 Tax=Flavobacterium cerinum TaxID=2502784 RepID=A0ABY5IMU4_9FLAO|nr:hypothetical protein [Flavobacterium cerinum]UUC44161.1 hypothetical protein NOX80_11005 [Flavobacterium cerinum]